MLFLLQQSQFHQIQQPAKQHPQIQQNPQVQQSAQEQQKIPVPEDLNSGNGSDDSEWDDTMDLVFGIKRNITLHIPHGPIRGQIIYDYNRSNFDRDH